MSAFERILDAVKDMPVIDTHEHLPPFEHKREQPTDILREYLTHYFDKDLISAGFPQKDYEYLRDTAQPIAERWARMEPYFSRARNTAYCRSLDISARALYGMPFDGEHIEALNEAYLKSLDGQFRRVLKERCNIEVSILDAYNIFPDKDICDAEFFRPVFQLAPFIAGDQWYMNNMGKRAGVRVRSLADYLELIDWAIGAAKGVGYVGFKSAMAYHRPLYFSKPTFHEAEAAFNARTRGSAGDPYGGRGQSPDARILEDYVMHRCLRAIEKTGMPLQLHTGLLEGNGNALVNSDPEQLCNILLEYRDITFDIFHIGYPYWHTVSALGKMFPNVHIDMCWAHIMSPEASVNAMLDFLDAVPRSKVSAFGGDYCLVDAVYGHQYIMRRNVARALGTAVDNGVMDADDAIETAHMWLYDNPKRVFNL